MENCTQVIDISSIGFDISDLGRVKVATLTIDETSYDIFKGENVIGRDELCDIVLRNDCISSRHAVVEVENFETHMLFDCGSTNKTQLGKIFLKPNVRYILQGDDNIVFADLKAKYKKLEKPEMDQNNEDSVSNADSESILNSVPLDPEDDLDIVNNEQSLDQDNCLEDGNRKSSNTFSDLNDSSLLEENKQKATTSKLNVVDASDDSTDDEVDFIPPSQTVKEFVSNKHLALKKKCNNEFSRDIFGDVATNNESGNVHTRNESNHIFNTQEQDMLFLTEKTSCNKISSLPDMDSQSLFNTEAQESVNVKDQVINDPDIFAAETQGDNLYLNTQMHNEIDQRSPVSGDIFGAETEAPEVPVSSDVEMSDLALSDALTELNMSLQSTNSNITEALPKNKNRLIKSFENKSCDYSQGSIVKDSAEFLKLDKRTNSEDSKTIGKNVTTIEQQSKNEHSHSIPMQLSEQFHKEKNNGSTNITKNLVKIVKIEGTTSSEIAENSQINHSSNLSNTVKEKLILNSQVEEMSDPNCVKNTTDQSSVALSNDNSGVESADISDMLTQVNISLVPKISTSQSDLENEDIFDACTQINASLNSNPMTNSIIKTEIEIKEEFDYELLRFAAEETQLNLNIQKNNTMNKKQKISRNSHTRPVEDISNVEAEETKPNLNIYSFCSVSKIEPDMEDNISNLQTQPFYHKASTEEDEGSKLLGETIQDSNIKKDQGLLFNIVPSIVEKKMIMKNEQDVDDNSNQSDSVLASVPIDHESLEQENLQSGILKIPESGKQNERARQNNNDIDFNSTHNKYCEASKKSHQEITLDEMDICSTVGEGTYISACGSSRKEQISLKIKQPLAQNSCQKTKQISSSIKASEMLNHSMLFNEPCGSSTPLIHRREDEGTGGKNKKNNGRTVLKTPPKGINKRMVESPDLPCTDDLLAVAIATPESQKCTTPGAEAGKIKENLPLALKKTPRARKLSRKMAESLKGQEGAALLCDPSSLTKNNITVSGEVTNNSNKEKADSFEKGFETKKKVVKRKSCSQKTDYSDAECKESVTNTKKDMSKCNNLVKNLSVNLIDIKNGTCKKADTEQYGKEEVSPAKKIKRKEIEENNEEALAGDDQSGFKQRSTRQKKQVDQLEGKKEKSGRAIKTPDKRKEIVNDELLDPRLNKKENKSIEKLNQGLKKLSKRKPENNSIVGEPSLKDNLTSSSSFLIDNADVSSNTSESSLHRKKLQPDQICDRSPSKRVKLNKVDKEQHAKRPDLELKSSLQKKSDQSVQKSNSNPDKSTSFKKSNRVDREKTETLSKIEFSGALKSPLIYSKPGTDVDMDVINTDTNKHLTLQKRSRNTETRENAVAENSKQSKNIKKNEKQTIDKEHKMNNIESTTPKKSDIQNVDDNIKQSKYGKKDNQTKTVEKDRHETSSVETTNRCSELPETKVRKSSRRKKDDNVDITSKESTKELAENKLFNENEATSECKSKRKLKNNLIETPKFESRRNSRKKREVLKTSSVEEGIKEPKQDINLLNDTNLGKIKSKESFIARSSRNHIPKTIHDNETCIDKLNNPDVEEDHLEKSSLSRNSSRLRKKPARFLVKEDIDASDSSSSDKGPSSTRRRKRNEVSTNVKSGSSLALEEISTIKEQAIFIAPLKSVSHNSKKQSEIVNTSVVQDRRRQKSERNEKLRSRSRSDSLSSQSSLRSDTSLLQSPRRSGSGRKHVLFSTGLRNDEWESQVKKLGGSVVDCPMECSLMVTEKVRRTVNFLCVLGQGKPIVTPDWITQSWRCTGFEEPMDHLLVDKDAEKKFNFSLLQTVQMAKKQPLLKDFHIHATPSVKPPPEDLKSIVECCGGEYVEKIPSKWPENIIIISHLDDKSLWRKFKVKGVTPPIVAAEMLLIGVLQHKLEVDIHRIS